MDQTVLVQENRGSDTDDSISIGAQPMGYLRIMAQQGLQQTDYPVYEGESSIGRGVNCDLSIEGRSLSRKHAVILVESGTHFVQDNASRNRTYRGNVPLRPNAFYELTNGCELTFADIKCQYFFGPPKENVEKANNHEETQVYFEGNDGEEDNSTDVEDIVKEREATEATTDDHAETHDGEDIHKDAVLQENSAEATQAYHVSEEEEERKEKMECEPTVAYNLGTDEEEEDREEESAVPSPPLLANRDLPTHSPGMEVRENPVNSESISIDEARKGKEDTDQHNSESDDETDIEEEVDNEEVEGGKGMMVLETVAYNIDTNEEEDDSEEGPSGIGTSEIKEKPRGSIVENIKDQTNSDTDAEESNELSKNKGNGHSAGNNWTSPNPSTGESCNNRQTSDKTIEPTAQCDIDDLTFREAAKRKEAKNEQTSPTVLHNVDSEDSKATEKEEAKNEQTSPTVLPNFDSEDSEATEKEEPKNEETSPTVLHDVDDPRTAEKEEPKNEETSPTVLHDVDDPRTAEKEEPKNEQTTAKRAVPDPEEAIKDDDSDSDSEASLVSSSSVSTRSKQRTIFSLVAGNQSRGRRKRAGSKGSGERKTRSGDTSGERKARGGRKTRGGVTSGGRKGRSTQEQVTAEGSELSEDPLGSREEDTNQQNKASLSGRNSVKTQSKQYSSETPPLQIKTRSSVQNMDVDGSSFDPKGNPSDGTLPVSDPQSSTPRIMTRKSATRGQHGIRNSVQKMDVDDSPLDPKDNLSDDTVPASEPLFSTPRIMTQKSATRGQCGTRNSVRKMDVDDSPLDPKDNLSGGTLPVLEPQSSTPRIMTRKSGTRGQHGTRNSVQKIDVDDSPLDPKDDLSDGTVPVSEPQSSTPRIMTRKSSRGQRGGQGRSSTQLQSNVEGSVNGSNTSPACTDVLNSTTTSKSGVDELTDTKLDVRDESFEVSPDINNTVKNPQSHDSSLHDVSDPSNNASSSVSNIRGRGSKRRRGGARGTRKVPTPSVKCKEPSRDTPTSCQCHDTSINTPSDPLSTPICTLSPAAGCMEDKPRVMFTGIDDKNGEKTVKELGGELVDSVFQCSHLVTDKVRRTVKFLCCLSRGCMIVSDSWLDQCAKAGRFIPAKGYLIKDKSAERLHRFSLAKSHETARHSSLLSGYEIHLTPSLKPDREQMTDIIKCSGGEAFNLVSPVTPGENVIIVSCENDLSMCKESMDAGVPVHSAELILGGVLRQELDLKSNLMMTPSVASSRKRREKKEYSVMPTAKRKRK